MNDHSFSMLMYVRQGFIDKFLEELEAKSSKKISNSTLYPASITQSELHMYPIIRTTDEFGIKVISLRLTYETLERKEKLLYIFTQADPVHNIWLCFVYCTTTDEVPINPVIDETNDYYLLLKIHVETIHLMEEFCLDLIDADLNQYVTFVSNSEPVKSFFDSEIGLFSLDMSRYK